MHHLRLRSICTRFLAAAPAYIIAGVATAQDLLEVPADTQQVLITDLDVSEARIDGNLILGGSDNEPRLQATSTTIGTGGSLFINTGSTLITGVGDGLVVNGSLINQGWLDNRRVVVTGSLVDQTSTLFTGEFIVRPGGTALFERTIPMFSSPTTLGRVTVEEGATLTVESGFLVATDIDVDGDADVSAFAEQVSFDVGPTGTLRLNGFIKGGVSSRGALTLEPQAELQSFVDLIEGSLTIELSERTRLFGNINPIEFGGLRIGEEVTLNLVAQEQFELGRSFRIFNGDEFEQASGTFAGLPDGALGTLSNGQAFRIDYGGGFDGFDIEVTVVPEPAAAVMLLAGGLTLLRRR